MLLRTGHGKKPMVMLKTTRKGPEVIKFEKAEFFDGQQGMVCDVLCKHFGLPNWAAVDLKKKGLAIVNVGDIDTYYEFMDQPEAEGRNGAG